MKIFLAQIYGLFFLVLIVKKFKKLFDVMYKRFDVMCVRVRLVGLNTYFYNAFF